MQTKITQEKLNDLCRRHEQFIKNKLCHSPRIHKKAIAIYANFNGFDLSFLDMSGFNLSTANFANANLRGTNFSHTNLKGCNMNRANLEGANMTAANLQGVYLKGSRMINVIVSKELLNVADFSGLLVSTNLLPWLSPNHDFARSLSTLYIIK